MEKEKRIGALYIRVSTDRQEELSPDAQIRLGLEYAAQHHIHIPNDFIFRDDGISGKKAERRPGFKSLIATARSKGHPIDCILVWKFSRFARNQEESIVYKSMLSRDKVEVISISEPLPDGPFGALNERIIEWMDEYYLTNLSTEVVRGMTENAMRGNYQASPAIGYCSVAPKQPPEKDSKTSFVIEQIDKWFMQEHISPRQIAVRINSMGYRTKRGNLFDSRGIIYILRNPFYAGKIRWNYTERGRRLKPAKDVILVDGRHEPYYDWEHYLAIQNRLDELLAKVPPKKVFSAGLTQRACASNHTILLFLPRSNLLLTDFSRFFPPTLSHILLYLSPGNHLIKKMNSHASSLA